MGGGGVGGETWSFIFIIFVCLCNISFYAMIVRNKKQHLAAQTIWGLYIFIEYFWQLYQNVMVLLGFDHYF